MSFAKFNLVDFYPVINGMDDKPGIYGNLQVLASGGGFLTVPLPGTAVDRARSYHWLVLFRLIACGLFIINGGDDIKFLSEKYGRSK